METVVEKLNQYAIDLKQAKKLAGAIIKNPKATDKEKHIAKIQILNLTSLILRVIAAIDVLNRYKNIETQYVYWEDIQHSIEKMPRNKISSVIDLLSEKYILLKK